MLSNLRRSEFYDPRFSCIVIQRVFFSALYHGFESGSMSLQQRFKQSLNFKEFVFGPKDSAHDVLGMKCNFPG